VEAHVRARGFTLIEQLVAVAVTVSVFASLLVVMIAIKQVGLTNRHHVQAIQVVRGEVEFIKGTEFDDIEAVTKQVSYDAGADNIFGTDDDFKGTMIVELKDALDMDGDDDTQESFIDINGDGVNDSVVKPIRVSFSWMNTLLGIQKTRTVYIDTLIAQ
jgi:Tfp pilus assembly protein PilV